MRAKVLLAVLFFGYIGVLQPGLVHATVVATSLPGVKPGDNATYVPILSWNTNNVTAFPNVFVPFFVLGHIALRIITVQDTNVTAAETGYFLNGTEITDSIFTPYRENVNVQTQSSCTTNFDNQSYCGPEMLGFLTLVIAAGLHAPDSIAGDSSITLNQTLTEPVLGVRRTVNFINVTFAFTCVNYANAVCVTGMSTVGFVWDQTSGVVLEQAESVTLNSAEGDARGSLTFRVASTNIWTAPPPVDFNIYSNPSSVTLHGGESGSSNITISSANSFTGTVTLRVSASSPLLSCSLGSASVTLGSSSFSTVSCNGSQGTYTVTVTAASGSLSHSVTLTYTILHGRRGLHQ